MDHLAHCRREIWIAATNYIAAYQLVVGKKCEQRVAALLKGSYFVYEGHWATGKDKVCLCPLT